MVCREFKTVSSWISDSGDNMIVFCLVQSLVLTYLIKCYTLSKLTFIGDLPVNVRETINRKVTSLSIKLCYIHVFTCCEFHVLMYNKLTFPIDLTHQLTFPIDLTHQLTFPIDLAHQLTFPIDLTPLKLIRKTMIQAHNRHRANSHLSPPRSSIPPVICCTSLLGNRKFKEILKNRTEKV